MTARKRRANVDKTIENIQPSPLNEINQKSWYRFSNSTIYKCLYCPEQFLLKSSLAYHELMHTLNPAEPKFSSINFISMKVPTPIKTFTCPHCQLTFLTQQNVAKHIHIQHSNEYPFECEQCDMTFGTKDTLDRHRYVHRVRGGIWACNLCEMEFDGESQLFNHKRIHKWIVSLEPYFQENRVVDDSKLISQSIDKESIAVNASIVPMNGMKKCNGVKRTAAEAAAAAVAAVATAASKDVSMENATETVDIISISSDSAAPPPKKKNANQQERLNCHDCHKTFANITTLQRHRSTIHSGMKNLKCKQCDKTFDRQAQLKNHEKTHKKLIGHDVYRN